MKVKHVIIGKQFEDSENYKKVIQIVNKRHIKLDEVEANTKINIEKNLYFDILWPDSLQIVSENSINNNALVTKLNYIDFSILFTGDIEEEAEKILVSKYNNSNILKSTILKVGHHGSKSSSVQEFLDLVKPQIALIGVGKDNKYGHPNDEIIQRLRHYCKRIYRTDEDGEISIIINKNGNIKKIKKLLNNGEY